jgi:hypothetical protein
MPFLSVGMMEIEIQLISIFSCFFVCYWKVRALEREISDLQSEFENERTDYLETIRKQVRLQKLYLQIVEKMLPTLKKECNFR